MTLGQTVLFLVRYHFCKKKPCKLLKTLLGITKGFLQKIAVEDQINRLRLAAHGQF